MVEVLIIGHDGLDRKFLQQYRSYMPFLPYGKLSENYRSEYQITPLSWTGIYTGLKKEEHDMPEKWETWVQQRKFKPYLRDLPCVWYDIEKEGKTVGLYTMPLTYPPAILKGWCVSGFPSVDNVAKIVEPKEYVKYLDNFVGSVNHFMERFVGIYKESGREVGWQEVYDGHGKFALARYLIKNKLRTLIKILRNHPVDVLFVGWTFGDHALHYGEDLTTVYQAIGKSIVDTTVVTQAERLMIVSDHGMDLKRKWHNERATLFINGIDYDAEKPRNEWDIKDLIFKVAMGEDE